MKTKTYVFLQSQRVKITMKEWDGSRYGTVVQYTRAGANDLVTVNVAGKDGNYGDTDFKARSLKPI